MYSIIPLEGIPIEKHSTGAIMSTTEDKGRYDLIFRVALRRLANALERGAKLHGDRNWEKGLSISRYLDSAMRHLNKYRLGETDEDHLGAAFWNLHSLIHTEEMITQGSLPDTLDDIPKYLKNPTGNSQ
jgi:hypothetical protein